MKKAGRRSIRTEVPSQLRVAATPAQRRMHWNVKPWCTDTSSDARTGRAALRLGHGMAGMVFKLYPQFENAPMTLSESTSKSKRTEVKMSALRGISAMRIQVTLSRVTIHAIRRMARRENSRGLRNQRHIELTTASGRMAAVWIPTRSATMKWPHIVALLYELTFGADIGSTNRLAEFQTHERQGAPWNTGFSLNDERDAQSSFQAPRPRTVCRVLLLELPLYFIHSSGASA
ncbi:uncharacterized protein B0H18DRAFT_950305 [Fomitopsis serialis]|uniref:uncharacterized protein n=1 Tax=Fomitopsis serialis TaxID=139415 RepID=UPI0020076958|nr:uncharacterized protein B0H18DRAFT_950305 [Neoantrodia serialis]KAH9937457.1 hypothetical protein B0H18DRAFT_950305 [Neoantrodia serialis]